MYGGKSKYNGYIGRRMMRMELPGKRKSGRPKRWFIGDVVKADMAEVEVTENIGTTGDGKSAVATPGGKSRKKNVLQSIS